MSTPGPVREDYNPPAKEESHAYASVGTKDKNVRWYTAELSNEKLHASTRELLEQYSKIPSDQVVPHILKIRERAWDIFPYPCIGQFRFLDLSIGKSSHYDDVLSRVKSGDKFLDIGCCFGQDVRRLVYDGAPVANVHGSDLEQPFLDLGYDLFLDEDKLPRSTFLAADIFAESSPLDKLKEDLDIIHAASFFHLFNYADGTTIAHKLVDMLRKKPGNMILGRQMGNETAQEFTRKSGSGSMYRHNPESFKKWWEEIGEATGTKWEVDCERDPTRSWQSERGGVKQEGGGAPIMEPGAMPLRYCVKMI